MKEEKRKKRETKREQREAKIENRMKEANRRAKERDREEGGRKGWREGREGKEEREGGLGHAKHRASASQSLFPRRRLGRVVTSESPLLPLPPKRNTRKKKTMTPARRGRKVMCLLRRKVTGKDFVIS